MISAGGVVASDAATELDKNIRQSVVKFGYSDQTADAFLAMVRGWRCGEMQRKLEQAAEQLKQGKISVSQYADVEKATAERLVKTIRKEIVSAHLPVERSAECYDLADVAKKRQTHCLGYTQLFFILGSAIGLKVQGIQVEEHVVGPMPINAVHVACLVELRDGKTLQVDLTLRNAVSEAFAFGEHYAREGESWILKDAKNRLQLHPKLLLLDRDGIGAMLYTTRGGVLHDSNKLIESLAAHDKAVELNPRCGVAYWNRAICRADANRVTEAMADFNKAIELMPRHPAVYSGRGGLYLKTGRTAEAIADCSMAIALNPKDGAAYCGRADVYAESGRLPEAIADITKAIDLEPMQASLYFNRGVANLNGGHYGKTILDCTKAIELQADFAMAYALRGAAKAGLGKNESAKQDFQKARELDPHQTETIKNLAKRSGVEL